MWAIYNDDCLNKLPELDLVDAVITDPPYGLSFMGKDWDHGIPGVLYWKAILAAMKPGAHLLAFGGTRTHHRLMVAIEDAGFEIRDMLMWVYGSGFPKSLDVSKAIDKAAGVERSNERPHPTNSCPGGTQCKCMTLEPSGRYSPTKHPSASDPTTDEAKEWEGWGTALKPAFEPILLCRKPLSEKTVAANVLKWGTGALNIDASRVEGKLDGDPNRFNKTDGGSFNNFTYKAPVVRQEGRWPANLILDGSEEVIELFPNTVSGGKPGLSGFGRKSTIGGKGKYSGGVGMPTINHGDSGSAARFFKSIERDNICLICCVNNVEENLEITKVIPEYIVQWIAMQKANKKFVLNVKFAGRMCNRCGISIAHALVRIKSLGFKKEELLVILDYIIDFRRCILIQNLVSFAELWENIDIIPTIASLSILFGSVQHAIDENIKQEKEDRNIKTEQSRLIYQPKASKKERGEGNNHPTVKPLALMKYLCTLITPPNGVILDPFLGSGSTLIAAIEEGFNGIGIEMDEGYAEIAAKRLNDSQVV